jgi:hypothetical protein
MNITELDRPTRPTMLTQNNSTSGSIVPYSPGTMPGIAPMEGAF